MYRQLSGMERFMWMGGQHKPINFGMATQISGTLSDDRLAAALKKCTRRHPLSSVRVVVDGEGVPSFTGEDVAPVPVLHLTGEEAWSKIAQRELIQLFDWQTGPFIRLVWMESEPISTLLLVCDHMIADGLSAAYFLRDLLTHLGDPNTPAFPMQPLPAITKLIPEQIRNGFSPEAIFAEQMVSAADIKAGAPAMTAAEFLTLPPPNLIVRSWRLDRETTAKLIDRCHQEATTVHGAIGAAFLLAFAEYDVDPTAMTRTIQSPVNIRLFLEPSVGEDFGLFINHAMTDVDCAPERPFWAIARDVRTGIHAQRGDPAQMARVLMADAFFKMPDFETMLKSMPIPLDRDYDLSLTNLGRLDMPVHYVALTLEAIYGPILTVSPGETVVGVNSAGGAIHLVLACEVENDTTAVGERAIAYLKSQI